MGVKSFFLHLFFGDRDSRTSEQTRRKRGAEELSSPHDAKSRRMEGQDFCGQSNLKINPDTNRWSSQTKTDSFSKLNAGHIHLSKWGQNGKENCVQFSPYDSQNTNIMTCQKNTAEHNSEEVVILEDIKNGATSPARDAHQAGSAFFFDSILRNNPDVQVLGAEVDKVGQVLSSSAQRKVQNEDEVQIVKESFPKDRRHPNKSSVKRLPFKNLEQAPSSMASSTLFSSRHCAQPEIQILPSTSMACGVGTYNQYRSQSSLLSSDSYSSKNQSTLRHIKQTEGQRTYRDVLQMFRPQSQNKFSLPNASRYCGDSDEKFNSSSSRLQRCHISSPEASRIPHNLHKSPVSCSAATVKRINVPVNKTELKEPSTSASRISDPDLQYIGEVSSNPKKPTYADEYLAEILSKYEQKERFKKEIEEASKQSKLLEQRNQLAQIAHNKRVTMELEEQLKVYLRVTEELEEAEKKKDIPALPELTEEMQEEIRRALSASPDTVLVKAFNLEIKGRDIRTLKPPEWLNDEVINFYMNLLIERGKNSNYPSVYAFNTFFFPKLESAGFDSLKRWTRKVNIFAHDFLLVPVHRGMHWCMAIINMKEKQILYYDSMNGKFFKCLELLFDYLQRESLDKLKKPFDTNGWTKDHAEDIPQQNNGSDCGMFACMYAEYVSRGAPITFSQDDMPYFRRKVVYEILKVKLLC